MACTIYKLADYRRLAPREHQVYFWAQAGRIWRKGPDGHVSIVHDDEYAGLQEYLEEKQIEAALQKDITACVEYASMLMRLRCAIDDLAGEVK